MKNPTPFFWIVGLVCIGGCASPPPTAAQRQDAILADPMGYKPNMGQNTIGGDMSSFDKPGLGRDVEDAINP